MSMPLAIEVNSLSKKFNDFTAVDQISFSVNQGEFFGLLGPNGAGKTTLIRMLTTLLSPTGGNALIAGNDITKQKELVRNMIGVVPQAMTTDLDLTAYENMDIYGRFYSVPHKERKNRIEELVEMVGLKERVNDLVATYSGGMRRRLEIARGLIHKPSVLFLDEPTIGLDPQSRHVVWDLLQKFRQSGELTISLTTHYMEEAETLCDRVAIIDHGKIIALDSPKGLKANIPGNDIVVLTLTPEKEVEEGIFTQLNFVKKVLKEEGAWRIFVDDGNLAIPLLLEQINREGCKVLSVTLKQRSLEDVFIQMTGRSIRDEEGRKVSFLIGAGVPRKLGR